MGGARIGVPRAKPDLGFDSERSILSEDGALLATCRMADTVLTGRMLRSRCPRL